MAFVSKIRKETLSNFTNDFTDRFAEFVKGCKGSVNIKTKEVSRIPIPIGIEFENEEDLVAYILAFEEVEPLRIILPRIRNVMPSIIANEIIGVQPMTGPVSQIHAMRARYA